MGRLISSVNFGKSLNLRNGDSVQLIYDFDFLHPENTKVSGVKIIRQSKRDRKRNAGSRIWTSEESG
jgi:hypothetical protein